MKNVLRISFVFTSAFGLLCQQFNHFRIGIMYCALIHTHGHTESAPIFVDLIVFNELKSIVKLTKKNENVESVLIKRK